MHSQLLHLFTAASARKRRGVRRRTRTPLRHVTSRSASRCKGTVPEVWAGQSRRAPRDGDRPDRGHPGVSEPFRGARGADSAHEAHGPGICRRSTGTALATSRRDVGSPVSLPATGVPRSGLFSRARCQNTINSECERCKRRTGPHPPGPRLPPGRERAPRYGAAQGRPAGSAPKSHHHAQNPCSSLPFPLRRNVLLSHGHVA